MAEIFVGLGSNKSFWQRQPPELLRQAAKAVGKLGQGLLLSPLYESDAWPDPSMPKYANAVARLETSLAPEAIMHALLAIEASFGRVRSDDPVLRYGPRTMDLDLLSYGDVVMDKEKLTLPHPRIAERDFVLLPLKDVAPDWVHPVTGEGVEEMIKALPQCTALKLET